MMRVSTTAGAVGTLFDQVIEALGAGLAGAVLAGLAGLASLAVMVGLVIIASTAFTALFTKHSDRRNGAQCVMDWVTVLVRGYKPVPTNDQPAEGPASRPAPEVTPEPPRTIAGTQ